MLSSEQCVIFDLDGTLVDTAPDLYLALNHSLKGHGLPLIPMESARRHVGHGARKLIEHALCETGVPYDDMLLDQLLARYLSFYQDNISSESRVFPGLVDVLSDFQEKGVKMGVCTNKRESLSRQLLNELDLARFFPVILGADSVAVCKPDPHHLLETITRAGGQPTQTVMVGDSSTDVSTAKAADVPVIAVSFGYAGISIEELGGDRVIDHYDQLESTLIDLLI